MNKIKLTVKNGETVSCKAIEETYTPASTVDKVHRCIIRLDGEKGITVKNLSQIFTADNITTITVTDDDAKTESTIEGLNTVDMISWRKSENGVGEFIVNLTETTPAATTPVEKTQDDGKAIAEEE